MAAKKSNTKKSEVESRARPYLPTAIDMCAREHRQLAEYFLLMGKYNDSDGMLIPRTKAEELLAMMKSDVGRTKIRKLLDLPCEPQQLLALLTAGEHVEGQLLRLPTVAPDPEKIVVTRKEMDAVEAYQRNYAPSIAAACDEKGGRLADYVAVLNLPSGQPVVVPRAGAKEALEHLGYGNVAKEVDVPATNDDELLCVYKLKGKSTWSKLQFAPR